MGITAAFCPLSCQSVLDRNGAPIVGGRLYAFDAGTTTTRTVYSDSGLTTALPSPVKTDGFGRLPPIFVGLGDYKIILKDPSEAMLTAIDGLPGAIETSEAQTSPSGWVTGDVKAAHGDDIQDGWLPLNAKTIGNPASGATARANNDVQALFTFLWNKDSSLAVSGGRGVSASVDWAASKTIALPDYRGRVVVGVDQMGAAATAGVITSATTANPDKVGQHIGGEAVALSTGQLPVFTPSVTIQNAGAHVHTGATNVAGAHAHGGSTGTNGLHNHTYSQPAGYTNSFGGGSGGAITAASGGITSNNGDHSHGISTDVQGNHQHGFTTDSNGDHTHTATAAPIGSGGSHPNVQPGTLVYWHIKI